MLNICAIIFADDNNKEINHSTSTALLKVLFKPMIFWVTDTLTHCSITDICVVSSKKSTELNDNIKEKFELVLNDDNEEHCNSLIKTLDFLSKHKEKNVLVLSACTPFIDCETIKNSLSTHINSQNDATVISSINDTKGIEKAYWFTAYSLLQCLNEINCKHQASDILESFNLTNKKVGHFSIEHDEILLSAKNFFELNKLNELARKKELKKHMLNGVDIPCIDGVIISCDTKIGNNTVIFPNTIIKENVKIGNFCTIGPSTVLENLEIADNTTVSNTIAKDSAIGTCSSVGPFAHIRPDCDIKDNVRIGNFVEIKNSFVDSGSKLSHLLYVGDSDVGKKVNFGCGCVTVNYTGKYKYRTTIRDGAFIGCNSNLIAPVTVGEKAYIAAGSTITDSVPENSLAIAREKQTVKENWVIEKDPYK